MPKAKVSRNPKALEDEVVALRREVRDLGEQVQARANPPLSDAAVERLHKVYRDTGDPEIGKVLDEVCGDPDCEDLNDSDSD